MISSRYHGSIRLFFLLKLAGGLAIFWGLVWFLHLAFYRELLLPRDYLWFSLLIPLSSLAEFLARDKRSRSLSGLSRDKIWSITQREILVLLVVVFGFLVMSKEDRLSRVFLASFSFSYFLWIAWMNQVGNRLIQRKLFQACRSNQLASTLVLAPPAQIESERALQMSSNLPGSEVLGFVSYGGSAGTGAMSLSGFPVLGEFKDIGQICRDCHARVLLALGLDDSPHLIEVLQRICDSLGMRLIWVENKRHHFRGNLDTHQSGSEIMITNWHEPLEDPTNRIIKRAFDIAVALPVCLFVLPPLCLVVWTIHRLFSPGPLFYRQPRTGRNDEVFPILKFRTMHLNSNPGQQATKGDSRIFPGGNLLRKLSIDEFPQFWNVLRGEMSVVGPRPHFVDHDQEFAGMIDDYRVRYFAKPGVTGLAQVRGLRGETDTPNKIRHRVKVDQFYLRHWSFGLDLWIMICTAFQVIFPPRNAR